MRQGKTRKDKKTGAWARHLANKEARSQWMRDGGEFPKHTCNGKKNRKKGE